MDIQQNGQKKKKKRTNNDLQNITHTTKYRPTRTPQKPGFNLGAPEHIRSSLIISISVVFCIIVCPYPSSKYSINCDQLIIQTSCECCQHQFFGFFCDVCVVHLFSFLCLCFSFCTSSFCGLCPMLRASLDCS